MYWDMCNEFYTLCNQFSKIPKLCSLLPRAGAGSGLKIPGAGAAPKQTVSETLIPGHHHSHLIYN